MGLEYRIRWERWPELEGDMANHSLVAAVGDLGVELQVDIDLLQSQSPLAFIRRVPVVRYTRIVCRKRELKRVSRTSKLPSSSHPLRVDERDSDRTTDEDNATDVPHRTIPLCVCHSSTDIEIEVTWIRNSDNVPSHRWVRIRNIK